MVTTGLYRLAKGGFRTVVPAGVQAAIWRRHRSFPVRHLITLKSMLESGADHDAVYDETYFRTIDVETTQAAAVMVPAMIQAFAPSRVIDVGCGSGAMLRRFADCGVDVEGLEHSSAALELCRQRGLEVFHFDLEAEERTSFERFDLALSTEVAEHLPAAFADRYVDLLCGLSNRVILTAATPGQGGTDHVNEQPHEYWIGKFRERGFEFHEPQSMRWRAEWARAGIASCYWRNIMVFGCGWPGAADEPVAQKPA